MLYVDAVLILRQNLFTKQNKNGWNINKRSVRIKTQSVSLITATQNYCPSHSLIHSRKKAGPASMLFRNSVNQMTFFETVTLNIWSQQYATTCEIPPLSLCCSQRLPVLHETNISCPSVSKNMKQRRKIEAWVNVLNITQF